jgi:hypothetical protein
MSYLVSEEELARARTDAVFRQQLMALNLEKLLAKLNYLRRSSDIRPDTARQIREGVDLAVKLADRLQQYGGPQVSKHL